MTHTLVRSIPARAHVLTDTACDDLKASFKIDDSKSAVITTGSAFLWQFWAHDVFNTMEDGTANLYSGVVDGLDGFYGPKTIRDFTMKDGKFKLPNNDLPVLNFGPLAQLAPDLHRANENPVLKAFHLLFSRLHNKRMDAHGDEILARKETMATLTQLFLNEALLVCGMGTQEFFDVTVTGFNQSLEGVFAAGRWAHAQMPETTNGLPVFRHQLAGEVDMIALWDGSEMARELNLGVSTAMTKMTHVVGEHDIRERTFTQHNKHGLASWADAAKRYRIEPLVTPDAPIWAGMLMEAEAQGNGLLGPLGRRMVADLIAGSLYLAHVRDNPWKGAPRESLDIVVEAWT